MAQSIKLANNNYVDATGVWDSTLGMTQGVLNTSHLRKIGSFGSGALSISVDISSLPSRWSVIVFGNANNTAPVFSVISYTKNSSYIIINNIISDVPVTSATLADNVLTITMQSYNWGVVNVYA